MRKLCLVSLVLAVALSVSAQHTKWKAPKRPKRPQWEAPKQKAPEHINVWRPYLSSDNWFFDFDGGLSVSMAENMAGHPILKAGQPLLGFGIGRQYAYVWSTRLDFAYKRQVGWASKQALDASRLLGDGDYSFQILAANIDEMINLTNIFLRYNERRWVDLQLFFGVGVNYSWNFDDKVEIWSRLGYPVETTDRVNWTARAGLQLLWKTGAMTDVFLQGAYNVVDDNYNGVIHKEGFSLDSYADVTLGVRFHLADHYGDGRYYKVRRWEATSLRSTDKKVAKLLEKERANEFAAREKAEVVAMGELMKTRISFYVDRTFVNERQMENVRLVAEFLKKHPEVNLVVMGYSGASSKQESPDMQLAQRRAEAVGKALTRHCDVDSSRFELVYDEMTAAPFPMQGEWIDGVVFRMVAR